MRREEGAEGRRGEGARVDAGGKERAAAPMVVPLIDDQCPRGADHREIIDELGENVNS